MRVLIVDTCYSAFLEAHYRAHPGLAERPYEEQWRALMDTSFGTSDAYSFELGRLGHDAHEVIVDCEPLQAAWAREHGLADAAAETILLRQVDEFAPDVDLPPEPPRPLRRVDARAEGSSRARRRADRE